MAVWPCKHRCLFLVLVKTDLSSVHVYSSVHWTSHFLQVPEKLVTHCKKTYYKQQNRTNIFFGALRAQNLPHPGKSHATPLHWQQHFIMYLTFSGWAGHRTGLKLFMYMLPPEWIFQPEPFRLAQISPPECIQGRTQTFRPNIIKGNTYVFPCSSVRPLFHGECVLDSLNIAFRDEYNILHNIYEKQKHKMFLKIMKIPQSSKNFYGH